MFLTRLLAVTACTAFLIIPFLNIFDFGQASNAWKCSQFPYVPASVLLIHGERQPVLLKQKELHRPSWILSWNKRSLQNQIAMVNLSGTQYEPVLRPLHEQQGWPWSGLLWPFTSLSLLVDQYGIKSLLSSSSEALTGTTAYMPGCCLRC